MTAHVEGVRISSRLHHTSNKLFYTYIPDRSAVYMQCSGVYTACKSEQANQTSLWMRCGRGARTWSAPLSDLSIDTRPPYVWEAVGNDSTCPRYAFTMRTLVCKTSQILSASQVSVKLDGRSCATKFSTIKQVNLISKLKLRVNCTLISNTVSPCLSKNSFTLEPCYPNIFSRNAILTGCACLASTGQLLVAFCPQLASILFWDD